jgi:FdhE protein
MPLVIVDAPTRDDLLEISRRRWESLRTARPDLVPAIDLQERLLTIVTNTAHAITSGRLPRLSLPQKYLAAKLVRGVPVFAGEPIPVPLGLLQSSLFQLCDALAEGGAAESAGHIKAAIADGSMEAGSLLTASLTRNQEAIRTGSVHRALAPDLVWLIAELATTPFAYALQQSVFGQHSSSAARAGDSDNFTAACRNWSHGYCPACGSWPALAECADSHRVLRCSFCAVAWELDTYACIYCTESGEPFKTAAPDEERKDRRVEICGACRAYLKTIDLPELSPFPLVAVVDMETMDLDLAAMEHGYGRPPLREFATRR